MQMSLESQCILVCAKYIKQLEDINDREICFLSTRKKIILKHGGGGCEGGGQLYKNTDSKSNTN